MSLSNLMRSSRLQKLQSLFSCFLVVSALNLSGCISSVDNASSNTDGSVNDETGDAPSGGEDEGTDTNNSIVVTPPAVTNLAPADRSFSCGKDASSKKLCDYCTQDAKNIDADECKVLAALYYWTTGSSWNTGDDTGCFALYNGSTGTSWFGSNQDVETWQYLSVTNNHVTKIGLRGCIGSGILPDEITSLSKLTALELINANLSGTIPAAISSLDTLEKLVLSGNKLSGSIPADMNSLTDLSKLSFAENQLTGSVPPALGELTNLSQLDLDNNRLDGILPANLSESTTVTSYNYCDNAALTLPANFDCDSDTTN